MISELRRLSLHHFARHKIRVGLTVTGIALGVAAIVAVRILLDAVTASYGRMIDRIAGRAALQVVNGEGGVPEELLEEVRRVPGVVAASPSVFGWFGVPNRPGTYLFLFGVDLVSDSEIRDFETVKVAGRSGDPLAFIAEPDSIAVTTRFLEQTGFELGGRMPLATAEGIVDLTIRSVLEVHGGPASLFGGSFALMDVFAAQPLLGLDRRFTQIDLRLEEGARIDEVGAAVARIVGARGAVERPAARGELMERLLAGNRTVSDLAAMLSITVGVYLVFETMMIVVAQRRRDIGILRSVGMSRSAVVRMVFVEALIFGVLGSIVGLPLGLLLAHGLVPAVTGSTIQTYFLSIDVPDVSLRPGPAAWGVGLAMVATLIAAVLPAREAVRRPPLEALRPTGAHEEPASLYRVQALIGVTLMAIAIVMWLCWRFIPFSPETTGTLIVFIRGFGLLFMAPWVVRVIIERAEKPLSALAGITGALAGRNLVRNLRRVAITGAAFLVSLGGAVATATFMTSVQYTAERSVDLWFSNHDLALFPDAPVPESVAMQIAELPGVAEIGIARGMKVSYEGDLILFAGRGVLPEDPDRQRRRLEQVLLVEGDAGTALAGLARGEGALVNEAFVRRFAKGPGDSLRLATPAGEAELPILGTYFDPTFSNLGVALVDLSLFRALWGDRNLSVIELALSPEASLSRVASLVRERWATRYPMRIVTLGEFRRDVERDVARSYVVAYALMAIAFVIALVGVVNSLLASVFDRIREIGVLRSIGATRRQVARSFMLEATVMGFAGAVLAMGAGTLFGYVDLDIVIRRMMGITVFYRHPGAIAVAGCATGIVLAALAGWIPGRSAARLRPTEALRYE